MSKNKRLLSKNQLRKYQLSVAEEVYEYDDNFLAIPMGLGKTVIMLTAIANLIKRREVDNVLIIAPLLVAEVTWPDEIVAWEHTAHLTYEVVTGNLERRQTRAMMDADIHIINRENIPWLVEFMGKNWKWDMVVVDESSSFKNHKVKIDPTSTAIAKLEKEVAIDLRRKHRREDLGEVTENDLADELAKRTKKLTRNYTRFGALRSVLKYIDRMNLLSGTPAPNGLIDLWSQMYLIDEGKSLGRTISQYRERWFKSDYSGFKYIPTKGSFDEIMGRIADYMISLRAEDYIELPDVVYNKVMVTLPPKIMKQYVEFKRTLVADDYDVVASSNGVLVNKLCQFANGSLYREDQPAVRIHDLKLDALERIIEEAAGEPVIVAYSYDFDREAICKRFKHAVVLNQEADVVRKWNDGRIPLLVTHPASAAHGLNLQFGGHIAVWYGLNYSLELYLQFNKRLHRSGQTDKVVIHHILARDTNDLRVMESLGGKNETQDEILERVRILL